MCNFFPTKFEKKKIFLISLILRFYEFNYSMRVCVSDM